MGIQEFIQNEVLLPRLQQAEVLVVYDPDRLYRELCLDLATPKRRVVDASESSIESREAALASLQELGQSNPPLEGLLIYVPARAPQTEEDKQQDPFSLYGACGTVFPASDGDEYRSLCLRAKAEFSTEIRRIFDGDPTPDFAVIDAVGRGTGWPTLQALLKVESARDILFALLAPSDAQRAALKGQDAWISEAKALFQSTLGLDQQTRSKAWEKMADELWRFLLYSEFVYDLPDRDQALPPALKDVPHARPEAQPLVTDTCERLRNDQRTQALYIERAEAIERELNLPVHCRTVQDLGAQDTFPFEERAYLLQAVDALKGDDVDRLRQILVRHRGSIWENKGENQAQWLLVHSAVDLIQRCDDFERQLPDHGASQGALIDFYVGSLREVDRLQREFEQAAGDYIDVDGQMAPVMAQARAAYRRLVGSVQALFVRHLEASGWPPLGRLSNGDVFHRMVTPVLQQSGHRLAFFAIDALRYELGVELFKELSEVGQGAIQPACALLPSITPVGMAALMPGAESSFSVTEVGGKLAPHADGSVVKDLAARRKMWKSRLPEAVDMELEKVLNFSPSQLKKKIDGASLLLVRSVEIDALGEGGNTLLARQAIDTAIGNVARAIKRLAGLGIAKCIVAADHGHLFVARRDDSQRIEAPGGETIELHRRCWVGRGGANPPATVRITGSQLGYDTDLDFVFPTGSSVFKAPGDLTYYHGGLSLQELIVPVLSVRMPVESAAEETDVSVTLSNVPEQIATRIVRIDLLMARGLFGETEITVRPILVSQGGQVGFAAIALDAELDAEKHCIKLHAGKSCSVGLQLQREDVTSVEILIMDPTSDRVLAQSKKIPVKLGF